MRVLRTIALAMSMLAVPASAETLYFFRNVTSPTASTASPAPTQSTDSTTGITVNVPCVSCSVRTGGYISFQPGAFNTQGAVAWSLGSGSLPPGGALDPAGGGITGTAGAPGTSTFTLAVTDARGKPAQSQAVTFQVFPAPTLAYSGSSGPTGRSLGLSPARGNLIGPSRYAVLASSLPSGLSLDPWTGVISGTVNETAVGIRINVSDSDGSSVASAPFDITVTDVGSIAFPGSSFSGRTGVPLSVTPTLTAMRQGATLAIESGVVPAGMRFDAASGAITGTPTIPGTSANIVVSGPDEHNATVRSSPISITVAQPSIAYAPMPAYMGQPYSVTPTVTGLASPTFSKVGGTLPPGLGLSSSTGAIAGTPTGLGTYSGINVVGIDGDLAQAYSDVFSIQVLAPLTASFPALTLGRVGQNLVATASSSNFASNPTWAVSAGSLPSGLTLASSNGQVTGTPTAAGEATGLVLTATQGSNSARTQGFTIRIVPPLSLSYPVSTVLPRSRSASIPATVVGTIGTPAFALAAGALPPGLAVDSSTGAITGTPTTSGTSTGIQSRATDGGSSALSNTFAITVSDQTASMASAVTRSGAFFSQTATSTLVTSPSWTLTAGALPAGLVAQPSGVIEGTPRASGTFAGLQMTASGTDGSATTPAFQLRVLDPLSIAGANLYGQAGTLLSAAAPTVTGGYGALSFGLLKGGAVVSTTLASTCPGLSFSTANGTISGTPTAACSATLSYTVADDGKGDARLAATAASAPFTLTVTPAGAASVSPSASSIALTEGDAMALSATTTLSNPTWSVSGNPAWMTFAATGGTYATSSVSADVSAVSTYALTLTATSGSTTAQQTVSVTVNPASASLATPAPVRSGGAFSAALGETMSAPGAWAVSASPADVAGLAVSGTTLTGTAPSNTGTTFVSRTLSAAYTATTAPATGPRATASASAVLNVHPALAIAAPANQGGTAGTSLPFGAPAVTGQVGTLTYALLKGGVDVSGSLGTTCPGLTFSTTSGGVSGIPSSACSAALTYRVSDNGGTTSSLAATATSTAFTLTVAPAPAATASSATVSVTEGDAVSFSATTTLPNPTWTASGNPAWMTFAATGASYATASVSADVTTSTTYFVTLTASNGSGATSATTVSVTVKPAAATLAQAWARSGGTFGVAVTETMNAAGGWTATSNPADVTGLAVTGSVLSGTAPQNQGTAAITRALTATYTSNAAPSAGTSAVASASGTLTVHPSLTVASIGPQTVVTPASASIGAPAVTGKVGNLTWTLLSGGTDVSSTLPSTCPGLSFSTATGAITGVPTGGCSLSLTQRVSDDGGTTGLVATATSSTPFTLTAASVTVAPAAPSIYGGDALSLTASTSLSAPAWSVTGNPDWMTFAPSGTGLVTSSVSDSVTQTTTYAVTFRATSGSLSPSATANVTVSPRPLGLPYPINVRASTRFNVALDPRFGDSRWSIKSNPNDIDYLEISGTTLGGMTAANNTTNPANHYLTATASNGQVLNTWLYVYPRLSIDMSLARTSGPVDQPFKFSGFPKAVGLIGKATWATTSALPAGLTLDPNDGTLNGTPTEFGQFPVYVTVTDAADGATANASFNVAITRGFDIQYYRHESSATYLWDFGNPGTGSGALYQYVTIRNVSTKDVTLVSVSATGDASDVDAFQMQTGPVKTGPYSDVPGTNTWAHSYAPNGSSSVGSPSAYDQGSPFDCQTVLKVGYYCKMMVRVAPSSPGAKNGSISVTTQNNTTTIPAAVVSSGWIPGGSRLFTSGNATLNLGAARQITTRYFIVGGGNGVQVGSSRGGNSGLIAYGDTISDANGNLSYSVGAGATTYQTSPQYAQQSYVGPTTVPVYQGKYLYSGASANGGTSSTGLAGGGGYPGYTGTAQYDGQDGGMGPNYSGTTYGTINGVTDPRYGYPTSQPLTSGFKNATISYAPGGAGHNGLTGCGPNSYDGIYGGTGGGGGINITLAGSQSPVAVTSPSTAGSAYAHGLQGGGGQGFGGGGGGSESQSGGGGCITSNPRYGPGGVGAGGFVYIEWDYQ